MTSHALYGQEGRGLRFCICNAVNVEFRLFEAIAISNNGEHESRRAMVRRAYCSRQNLTLHNRAARAPARIECKPQADNGRCRCAMQTGRG